MLLVLPFTDVFCLLRFLNCHDPEQLLQTPVRADDAEQAVVAVDVRNRQFSGFFAFREIALRAPVFWPLVPFLYVPGVPALGRRAYAWIAANRSRLPVA